jgi:NADPH:quinone reductase-like Zn-dependent oxidoreductase
VGDRVALVPMLVDMAGMGALRDHGIYDQSALIPVPDGFSDTEGAAYWMAIFTMAGALEMAGFSAQTCRDKSIVFTAATGGMGIVALKLLRGWGATVIATTRDDTKVSALETFADHVALVRASHELAPAVKSLVPEGVAAVIDPLGGTYVGAAIDALGHGGHYVGYEMLAGNQGTYDIPTLMAKDAHLHGFTIFRLLRHPGLIRRLVTLGMEYAVEARPMVAGIFPFEEAPQAFETLARGGHLGKIVVAID